MNRVKYSELKQADLVIDAIYESNGATNSSGDVLSKLMSVGTLGGFRRVNVKKEGKRQKELAYVVLESTNKHLDWIDYVNKETGIIQYYGDNREPGRELHDTAQNGNMILKDVFRSVLDGDRKKVPPFFYFESEKGRNRRFIGLLVPGGDSVKQEDMLVAIWRVKNGERYQNYKAFFTILDVPIISRAWINDLINGEGYNTIHAPKEWKKWIDKGTYTPLCASDSVLNYRTEKEQMPKSLEDKKKLQTIYDYFEKGQDFEPCAMTIAQLMDSNIHKMEPTRAVRDGGRDAIGLYRIGNYCDGIDVEFALEAKRYKADSGVGVEEMSRLISRLRHRQFGILVTTSYVSPQAYQEIREDGHPVVIISGADILKILYEAGIKTKKEIEKWLNSTFPKK